MAGTPIEAASVAATERGTSASPAGSDPVVEAILREATVTLAPLLVASTLRQRAIEVVRGLVQNLSNWFPTGLPPNPPPPAAPAASGARVPTLSDEPLPRPLTIHGGSPQPGPNGENNSFSEQAGGSEASRSPGKTLAGIKIPPGLTVGVKSETDTKPEKQYENGVRDALGFKPAMPTNNKGEILPDGLIEDPETDSQFALEVKYLRPEPPNLRDPNRTISFINRKDVTQLRKYIDEFKGGLLLVVNDERLVGKYAELMRGETLSGFRIVYVASQQD